MGTVSLLSDADLHGLVDGHMDSDRRAEMLRRAAASPRDRALIEAWQEQNDLIRAAFAGVEREPLPRALDLRTPPRLHAVPLAGVAPSAPVGTARWRRVALTVATAAAMAAGLAGSWYVSDLPADAAHTQAARVPDVERMLSDRTVAALAFGDQDTPATVASAEPPPTSTIPDLAGAGFTFTGAEARGISPKSVIFRYRNAQDERVAIGATRDPGPDSAPAPRDNGFTWRNRRVAYAIFGTVAPDRLRAAALSLKGDAPLE